MRSDLEEKQFNGTCKVEIDVLSAHYLGVIIWQLLYYAARRSSSVPSHRVETYFHRNINHHPESVMAFAVS